MLHEEQLNTQLLLISLTCNTPRIPSPATHLVVGYALCPLFVCVCTCLLVLIFNSLYERAVLLAMSWLVSSKPESTSKWSLAWQPEPTQAADLLPNWVWGVTRFFNWQESKAKGVLGSQGRHYCLGPQSRCGLGVISNRVFFMVWEAGVGQPIETHLEGWQLE